MSSPIDCSSPADSPAASLSSSPTISDGQSSATIANDPIVPDADTASFADTQNPGGERLVAAGAVPNGGRPFARRDLELRRGMGICTMVWGLLFLVFAFLSALYAPGGVLIDTPPGCRAPARSWMAASRPEPVRDFIPLDVTTELMGIVKTYDPFLGAKVSLLPLSVQSSGHANDPIGASHDFFDKMSRAVTGLCDSIKQSHRDAVDESLLGHVGRRHAEVIENLCLPLLDLVSSTSTIYLEIAHALAGPYPEALWLRQVAKQLSVMAEQLLLVPDAADISRTSPGDVVGDVVSEADYFETNNSAADVFQAYMGVRGVWPMFNSRFIGALWELRSNCDALGEAFAAITPVTHSFIVGMSASLVPPEFLPVSPASRDGGGGEAVLLQAQVIDDWLHLESALPVLGALTAAADEGISALVMANHQLQVLHDRLGSLRASCWLLREAGAGGGVAVHLVLAEPRSLHDEVAGVSKWLEMQVVGT